MSEDVSRASMDALMLAPGGVSRASVELLFLNPLESVTRASVDILLLFGGSTLYPGLSVKVTDALGHTAQLDDFTLEVFDT